MNAANCSTTAEERDDNACERSFAAFARQFRAPILQRDLYRRKGQNHELAILLLSRLLHTILVARDQNDFSRACAEATRAFFFFFFFFCIFPLSSSFFPFFFFSHCGFPLI